MQGWGGVDVSLYSSRLGAARLGTFGSRSLTAASRSSTLGRLGRPSKLDAARLNRLWNFWDSSQTRTAR